MTKRININIYVTMETHDTIEVDDDATEAQIDIIARNKARELAKDVPGVEMHYDWEREIPF